MGIFSQFWDWLRGPGPWPQGRRTFLSGRVVYARNQTTRRERMPYIYNRCLVFSDAQRKHGAATAAAAASLDASGHTAGS